jgi:hypothetical protein
MAIPPVPWTTDQDTFEEVLDDNPELLGFVSEGDSWFAFPSYLGRMSIISLLSRQNDGQAYWLRRETSGDTVQNIMFGPQYASLVELLQDEDVPIHVILFSGGGNDIVDKNMLSLLNKYQPGMTAMDCINQTQFTARIQAIKGGYEKLIELRDRYRPGVPIVTHAYDFAIPTGKPVCFFGIPIGPWIKNMQEQKDIRDALLQKQIVTYMLQSLARMQEELENQHSQMVYIRTQGTLDPATDWGDELHPTKAGFKKVATKFQLALRAVFPGLPLPDFL